MAYTVTPLTSQYPRTLLFWKTVKLLKINNKIFGLFILKNSQPPSLPQGIEYITVELNGVVKIVVKENQAIDTITDNLGNIYFDVTGQISV